MSPIFLMNQRCFNPNKSILRNSGSFLSYFKYIILFLFLFPALLIEGQTTVTYNTSGTYTFTVPSGVSSVTVQCWGAGGAGGGVSSNGYFGGAGGAGGAYASKSVAVIAGSNYTINVGQGGNGGTGNGPAGGNSWFGTTSTVIAIGGNGGGGNNGSPGIGTASGNIGSTVYKGGDGTDGFNYYGVGGGAAGSTGNGGSGMTGWPWSGGSGTSVGGGNGGDGLYSPGNGNPGLGAGGGGSGAYTTNSTNYSGGNGADGQVIITYYLSLPTITSFTPSGGCANSTTVIITGTKFTGATSVTFGGTNAASFTVNSATQITATVGAGTTGAIIVTTPSGNATSASNFTFSSSPTLTGVSICQGSTGSLTASTSCLSGGSFTVGPNDAGTGATGGGSGFAWSNTGRVTANDNNYANSSINKYKSSEALNATNYGFSIPSNAIINGVQVAIGRYGSGSNSLQDNSVKLIVGGSTQGNNNGDQSTFWPTSGTPANYGSTSDLWGNSLTPAQINDPNFGVALVVDNNNNSGSRTAYVDYIEITVTYTIPGSLDWYTVSSGGSSIGSGSPFNPVGVSGSGLANTNTAGTTVFYAECSSAPGCRASTNFTINSTPSVSSTTTPTCVGGSTGTINVSASGGGTPYNYSLNGGTYQTSSLFTGFAAGTYTLNVKNSTGCVASSSVVISSYANSSDNQNATGTDSWIGHMYSGMNFQNYIGHFTETETFNEQFGGGTTCFNVTSNSATSSIYTENFSVRFRMNSTKNGLYVVDLGSDDGSRLTVDGTLIYNNWSDQAISTRPRVLMNLNGASSLNYEFYENGGLNQVIFQNLTLVLANSLTTNTTQSVCLGSNGSVISGDSFGALPSGISLSGTGYQWSYSVTPGGARTNIPGATSATYIPNTSASPFNVPGTYYIYRKAILSSSNNTGVNPYVATNESNAATITVNALPATPTITAGGPTTFCSGGSVTLTSSAVTTYLWSTGATTASISATTAGSYTVKVTNASGCQSASSAATVVTVNALPATPTITAGGLTTFCSGGSVTLTSSAGTNYLWSTGATTASISPTTAGSYTVKVTNASGCQSASSAAKVVTVNALPATPTITAGGSTTFCSGGSVTLTSSAGTTYLWSTGATTASISATAAGSYTVKVTNASGCQSAFSAAKVVTVNALPVITSQPSTSTQNLCLNAAVTQLSVTATGVGLSYQWYSNTTNSNSGGTLLSGSTSSTYTPVTTTAGTLYYYVKVSGTCTPAVTSNISGAVTVSAPPSATISYAGSPFCYNTGNANVTFSGTTGGTYSITPAGANINSGNGKVNLASSTPGTYTVTYSVAAAGGCSIYTTSTQIVINPNTWIGNSNSNWNNSGNWAASYTTGCPDVTILGGVPYQPLLNSGTISINNLIINSGANLTLTNATLQISGTISNSGTFDASAGTIEMNGSSAQTIAGSLFANKTIKNLIVSNAGTGLSVSSAANDTLKITGALTFGNSSSTLNTGDNIDLVSDINATANVGVVNPGNTINGKVIAERYIPTGTNHGKSWQFVAAPTNSQTIKESWMEGGVIPATPNGYGSWITGPGGTAGGFDASSATPSMKTYSPSTDSWITVGYPTTTPIHNDNGYMIFVRGDRSVFNFSGANSAAVPTNLRAKGILLTGTLPPINVPAGKYQSIGNPYASRIEFSKISKNNVDDVFYVWDPLLYGYYGYGGYQTLSGTNNYQPTVPNGGTANYQLGVSYPYIESGQAFFVHNSSGTNGAIIFTENVKATGTLLVNRPGSVLTQRQFFRVYLYTNAGLIADGNAVAFDNNFANTVDGNDALKIMNSGENFGIKRAGKILAVEARSPVEASDTVFYNLSNFGRKTYQLHFAPENMRGSGLSAYLVDKYLKTSTPVNLDDTSTVAITVNADAASSAADRLMVVFSPMAALPVTFTTVKAYQEGKDITVEWNVENESNMQQYEVEKSSDGNSFTKVATVAAINGVANNYQWLDQNITSEYNYYRIRSVDINGKTNYTQVVKVLVGKSGSEIRVYPNPIINGTINLQLTNQPPGIYEIKLINPLGQEIISKKIIHAGGNIIETIELNDRSAKGVYQLKVIKPDGSEQVNKVLN